MRAIPLLVLAALSTASAQTEKPPAPRYEVFAVRYAIIPDFAVNQLVAGAEAGRKLDIAMMVWLIRGNGRNILFDTGFYRAQFFKQWRVTEFVKPSDAVRRAGVAPEDVTDAIVSHMHWDHADGMDLFPRAKVWLQKDELEYYAGTAWQSRRTHGGIEPDDVMAAVKLNLDGRVGLVNGDAQEILPGITCYTGGKHTYASQFISVNTASGTVVLASDNLYLYENLAKRAPIAATLDAESNLRAQDRMRQLASKPEWIVPGHDPAVMQKFPEVAPGVVRIQ